MINSLHISKTGMQAQQTQLDVISHNLANVSTSGFKRSNAIFEDLIYQNLRQVGANTTEVAINGNGFFQSELPDGNTAYTRDGTFQVNSQGQVVTSSGYRVLGGITVPQDARTVTISTDGQVSAVVGNSPTPQPIGNIQLAIFVNPPGLEPRGQNLFSETLASGSPTTGTPGTEGFGQG